MGLLINAAGLYRILRHEIFFFNGRLIVYTLYLFCFFCVIVFLIYFLFFCGGYLTSFFVCLTVCYVSVPFVEGLVC